MHDSSAKPIRLMALAPGHFHAALVQKHLPPGVAARTYVYGPLDDDTVQHVARVAGFNNRADDPTAWELDLRAGANYLDRFLREQPGNTVVISGRNKPKIDLILTAVEHGLSVIADKPWVIDAADLPKLDRVFREADLREVVAWDVMTERFEVTNAVMREMTRDAEVFGEWTGGSPDDPSLTLESTHHLLKPVAGVPLRRPAWWFDPTAAGDGLADVGTHLADLALWLIAPEAAVDWRQDVQVLDADRWPLPLSRADFAAVTGHPDFPPELARWATGDHLRFFGNGATTAVVSGVHVRLTTVWDLEAEPEWGDTHDAAARGTRSSVHLRHERAFGPDPQVFVRAADPADHAGVFDAVTRRCETAQHALPGVAAVDRGDRVQVHIPDALRVGHEAHFGAVLAEFARYFHAPRGVPRWERPNMLAKYYLTTAAVELSRKKTGGA